MNDCGVSLIQAAINFSLSFTEGMLNARGGCARVNSLGRQDYDEMRSLTRSCSVAACDDLRHWLPSQISSRTLSERTVQAIFDRLGSPRARDSAK